MLKLKHWQLFALTLGLIGFVAYPTFLLTDGLFGFSRSFGDSVFPALGTTIVYTLWFNSVLKFGRSSFIHRIFAVVIFLGLFSMAVMMELGQPSPHWMVVLILFMFAVFWLAFVVYPTASIFRTVEQRPNSVDTQFIIDLVAVAAFFPFGLWYMQPRLNKASSIVE